MEPTAAPDAPASTAFRPGLDDMAVSLGKGGRESLYAVDYAARVALELGADIVKLNIPGSSEKDALQPQKYRDLEWDYAEGARRVIANTGRVPVLVRGGSQVSDEALLQKARVSMEAGTTGLIFGRNMWQRPFDDALAIVERVKREVLAPFGQ